MLVALAMSQVVLDYDPAIFAVPGLAMLEARKLNADGEFLAVVAYLGILSPTSAFMFFRVLLCVLCCEFSWCFVVLL